MSFLAQILLFGCIPFIFVIFSILPARRAVIASSVLTWLFMPNTGFVLVGLPDYSKVTAASFGIILATVVFDAKTLSLFRFRWYDLPAAVWCLGGIPTALSNGLPLYDGMSESLKQIFLWGVPYFAGRVFLVNRAGQRDLVLGIIYGGLLYAPLCLFEIRFSPTLQRNLFGTFLPWELPRYGLGYRPLVFMVTGLEVAMWMCASALLAYWLWTTKAWTRFRGLSTGPIVLGLLSVAFLCKSVGAICQLLLGLATLWVVRRARSPIPVIVLLIVPTFYLVTRSSGVWSGRDVVDFSRQFDIERAASFEFRLDNEDILMDRARERPILGWGGWGRNRVFVNGIDISVTDGYWIIALGMQGFVGLASVTLVQLLPVVLLLRRHPARTWAEPEVAPSAAIAVMLVLYAMDNLSNAMFNPVYVLAMGGLMGFDGRREPLANGPEAGELAKARAYRDSGRFEQAEVLLTGALALVEEQASRPNAGGECLEQMAEGYVELADLYLTTGRRPDGEVSLRRAIEARRALASARPGEPNPLRQLADDLETLGRLLHADRRPDEADEAWAGSLGIREELVKRFPGADVLSRECVDGRNDFAWILTHSPRPGTDDLQRAVHLAESAALTDPSSHSYANTLGVARYRSGDLTGAAAALEQAVALSSGGTAFDHYVLAMTSCRLGDYDRAFEHLRTGDDLARGLPDHAELAAIRQEAAALVGAPLALPSGGPARNGTIDRSS